MRGNAGKALLCATTMSAPVPEGHAADAHRPGMVQEVLP
jgi:hypothetical protein